MPPISSPISSLTTHDPPSTPPFHRGPKPPEADRAAASKHAAAIGRRGRCCKPQPAPCPLGSARPLMPRMPLREGAHGLEASRGAPWPVPCATSRQSAHISRRAMHEVHVEVHK